MKWQLDEEMILAKYVLEKGTDEGFQIAESLLNRSHNAIRAKWHRDGDRLMETYVNIYSVKDTKPTKESLWKRILRKLLRKSF